MSTVNYLSYSGCLILSAIVSCSYADPVLQSFQGYWVYGFEQSFIETCDGKRYWMWAADEFEGKYITEGYKNPVSVTGYLLPSSPEININSSFMELKVVAIKHDSAPCRSSQLVTDKLNPVANE